MSQTTDGLIDDGETPHFAISYEQSMAPADGRDVAQALMNVIEGDLALVRTWFAGVDFRFSFPINVELHQAAGGAGWVTPPDIGTWIGFRPTVTVKAVGSPPPQQGLGYVRHLIVAEVTEMFMASKDNGWFENTTLTTSGDEGSKGEGLSRFLGHQFNVAMGIAPWFDGHTVVRLWLTSPDRADYVDSAPDDHRPDAATGGTTCFLYYLHDQLGFGIPEIIDAGSTNLAGVYQKLTGRTDAWTSYIGLVDLHYPRATTPEPHGDNVFPVPNLESVEDGTRLVGGRSTQVVVSLDRPTTVDVTVTLTVDDPTCLRVPATVTVPAGSSDVLVDVTAVVVPGPARVVTLRASYAGTDRVAHVTVLPAPSTLTVRVVQGVGTPVAQAVLVIDGPASAGVHAGHIQAMTAADGTYTTPPLPTGSYTVEVTASGYAPSGAVPVEIHEGTGAADAEIRLAPLRPITITGTVTDQSHQPLTGVAVTVTSDTDGALVTTTTDGAGAFTLTLDGRDLGDHTLDARIDGHVPADVTLTGLADGAHLVHDFALPAFGSLAGTITIAASTPPTPISGAEVRLGPDLAVATDAAGHYALPRLVPGDVQVDVTATGYEPATAVPVSVPSGEAVDRDLALTRAGATLTGTLVDATVGSPVSGATVTVDGATPAHSTADGSFTVDHVPAGARSVTVVATGYQKAEYTEHFATGQAVEVHYSLYPPDPPGPVR